MQKVENKKLAFSGVQITRRGKHPEQTVYRQPTHTDRFLHKDSNHQPTQKYGIIKTLAEGAKKICKVDTLDVELKLLEEALYTNRYSRIHIRESMVTTNMGSTEIQNTFLSRAYLPYVPRVTHRIEQLLQKENIRTVFKSAKKISGYPNVTEHTLTKTDHCIKFHEMQFLATSKNHFVMLHKEAVDIYKHKDNDSKCEYQ